MSLSPKLSAPYFLIATPQLQDPSFRRAVVLLVEHNSEGSCGFIVNRLSENLAHEVVRAQEFGLPSQLPSWEGGPVDRSTGILLHRDVEDGTDSTRQIAPGVCLSSSPAALKAYANHLKAVEAAAEEPTETEALYPFRFLVGYAGWGGGQLDEELRMGAWIQAELDTEHLFNTPWRDMWDAILGDVGINPLNLAPSAQPYLN